MAGRISCFYNIFYRKKKQLNKGKKSSQNLLEDFVYKGKNETYKELWKVLYIH